MNDAQGDAGRPLVHRAIDGAVVVLTLSRPERHNALIPEMLDQLQAAVSVIAGDPQVRALVVTGDGPSFSTGGDVAEFAEREGDELEAYSRRIVSSLHDVVLDLLQLDVPVIAAVHGPVTGGSLGLVLAADIVVAGPRASFAPWYVRVGFSPDGGWTALLPRRVGHGRSGAWQLANRTIDAAKAEAWGLVDEVADDAVARARALAGELAGMVPGSVARTKRLLRADIAAVRRALDAELGEFVTQIQTPEAREGMRAFLSRGDDSR